MRGVREALSELASTRHEQWDRVYVPCAGEFAANKVLSNFVPPEKHYASDITLFSSTLGHALAGNDLLELGVVVNDPEDDPDVIEYDESEPPDDPDAIPRILPSEVELWNEPWSEWMHTPVQEFQQLRTLTPSTREERSPEEHQAALRYASRVLLTEYYFGMPRRNYYIREYVEEVATRRDHYADVLREDLEDMREDLAGINYEIADCREVAIDVAHEEDAFLFLDPPAYSGGYDKMFDTGGLVEWNEPSLTQFEPGERQVLLDHLEDKPVDCAYLLYVNDIAESRFDTETWDKFFAQKQSELRVDYMLANWETGLRIVKRPPPSMEKGDIPIFEKGDWLNKHSEVSFEPVTRPVAKYYRNLLVKNFKPGTSSEHNGVFIVDGKMVGVVGVNTNVAIRGGKPYVYLIYGITPIVGLSKPLSRLVNRFLQSREFFEQLDQETNFGTTKVTGIRTTCFTMRPEARAYSGLWEELDCRDAEGDEPGRYRMQYHTEFADKSYSQQIVEYLDECDRYERLQEEASA